MRSFQAERSAEKNLVNNLFYFWKIISWILGILLWNMKKVSLLSPRETFDILFWKEVANFFIWAVPLFVFYKYCMFYTIFCCRIVSKEYGCLRGQRGEGYQEGGTKGVVYCNCSIFNFGFSSRLKLNWRLLK
jgi:hypothetical protein